MVFGYKITGIVKKYFGEEIELNLEKLVKDIKEMGFSLPVKERKHRTNNQYVFIAGLMRFLKLEIPSELQAFPLFRQ